MMCLSSSAWMAAGGPTMPTASSKMGVAPSIASLNGYDTSRGCAIKVATSCGERMHATRWHLPRAFESFKAGRVTFDSIIERILHFTRMRDKGGYFVRGTYARNTLAFAESVRELHSLGFRYISMEPVVLSADSALALQASDLPAIRAQYEELIAY